jgi:hypothetical protein
MNGLRQFAIRTGSVALLAWAAALSGCSTQTEEMNNLQREDAERQALIEAMKNHPAFNEAENGAATGKRIDVPVTVPPKPEGGDDHHDHPRPEPN